MRITSYYHKVTELQEKYNGNLNTLANHLLVIFAFFVPLSFTGRKSTFFLLFLVFLLRGKYVESIKTAIQDKLVQACVAYYAVHLVWLLGSDDFAQAGKVMHEALILLYPLYFLTLVDKKFIPRIFSAFFLGMLISELWSYGIYFEILPAHLHDGTQGTATDPTPVMHHTHYGFMLAVCLTFILQRLYYGKDTLWLKSLFIFFFITASINIFITAGRTGYVLYIILLFILFYRILERRLLAVSVTLAICIVAFFLAFQFSPTFQTRTAQTVDSVQSMFKDNNYESSLGFRAAVLIHSGDVIKQKWLTGVGTGDHLDAVRKHLAEKYPQYVHMANYFEHLHNEYFNTLIQFGIVGLLALLYLFYQLFTYPQQDRQLKNMQIIFAFAIIFFSFIDIFVLGQGALLIFVTLISLSFNSYKTDNAILLPLTKQGILKYSLAIIVIGLISQVT